MEPLGKKRASAEASAARLGRLHARMEDAHGGLLSHAGALKMARAYAAAAEEHEALAESARALAGQVDAALDAAAGPGDSNAEASLSGNDESPPASDAPSESGESTSKSGSGGSSPEGSDATRASPIEQQQVDYVPLPEDIEANELVAAKCPALDGTPEWLLVRAVCGAPHDGVLVAETEDAPGFPRHAHGAQHAVPRSDVLALPRPGAPLLPLRARVLALFPGTTALYPAVVVALPSRRRRGAEYAVRFADDTAPSRHVPPAYVVPVPPPAE